MAVAAKRLKAVPNSKSRVMILLTDGDNNLGKIDPLPAAQLAAALGVKIYAIGIGIEQPCNMPAFDPATGKFQLDANGNVIPDAAAAAGELFRARQNGRACPADNFIAPPTSASCKTFTTRLTAWKNPR